LVPLIFHVAILAEQHVVIIAHVHAVIIFDFTPLRIVLPRIGGHAVVVPGPRACVAESVFAVRIVGAFIICRFRLAQAIRILPTAFIQALLTRLCKAAYRSRKDSCQQKI
jgi:hypothetical protein